MLEAAKEEVKERTKVVIQGITGRKSVNQIIRGNKTGQDIAWFFSTPRGFDGPKFKPNGSPHNLRTPSTPEISLITRLATDTLDRDLTYAEWALMENVVKMEDSDTYMVELKTTVLNETQDFIKNNDRFLKAREIWSPNTKLKFGEGESMINSVNRLLPFANPEPITI